MDTRTQPRRLSDAVQWGIGATLFAAGVLSLVDMLPEIPTLLAAALAVAVLWRAAR